MCDTPDIQAVLAEADGLGSQDAGILRLQGDVEQPVYVIGKNAEAQAVLSRLHVVGIIDDFASEGSVWNGVPVVHAKSVPHGSLVINTSTSISPLSTQQRISTIPGALPIPYTSLTKRGSLEFPPPAFVSEARNVFAKNESRWKAIYEAFADDESRRVFRKIFAFRLTADPAYMAGFTVALRDQYFESFAEPTGAATFVDCGGFDGDTTEEFIRRYPDYRRVYLFEPSAENLAKAKLRLAGMRDIVFIPYGVSDADAELRFDANAGSASSISSAGNTSIKVTTLDSAVSAPVSFIKMDLEGWELPALKGSAGHIREDRPILAVAVYHRAADLWEIPEYIFFFDFEYDIYLRHYTEGWSETVMYFVPKADRGPRAR